jgi:hypothetical protein
MTLAEVEAIGREVGITPAVIRQAASSIDRGGQGIARSFLGLPIGVGHVVDLQRKLSDEEWERVVVDLRETFDARGTVRQEGTLRSWSNGNLQALLEPNGTGGHRLRLRTLKGDARAMIGGGLAIFGAGAALLAISSVSGLTEDPGRLVSLVFLQAGGLVMAGLSALRLPGWARLRRRQMEEIAGRLTNP